MSNVFSKFFHAVGRLFMHGHVVDVIAHELEIVQGFLGPGFTAAQMIAALTPTKSDDEIIALAKRYAMDTVTPEMLRTPGFVDGILRHAAAQELRMITSDYTTANRLVDLAVQAGYVWFNAQKRIPVPDQPVAPVPIVSDPTQTNLNQ